MHAQMNRAGNEAEQGSQRAPMGALVHSFAPKQPATWHQQQAETPETSASSLTCSHISWDTARGGAKHHSSDPGAHRVKISRW